MPASTTSCSSTSPPPTIPSAAPQPSPTSRCTPAQPGSAWSPLRTASRWVSIRRGFANRCHNAYDLQEQNGLGGWTGAVGARLRGVLLWEAAAGTDAAALAWLCQCTALHATGQHRTQPRVPALHTHPPQHVPVDATQVCIQPAKWRQRPLRLPPVSSDSPDPPPDPRLCRSPSGVLFCRCASSQPRATRVSSIFSSCLPVSSPAPACAPSWPPWQTASRRGETASRRRPARHVTP